MTKRCSKCKIDQELDQFARDKTRKDGLFPWCKPCHRESSKRWKRNNRAKTVEQREREKARKTANQEVRECYRFTERGYGLKHRYGISLDDYARMAQEQDNRCAICRRPHEELKKRLSVDHDHETGRVRGLLCDRCNWGIGAFGENEDRLLAAIDYLREHARVA